MAKLIGTIVKSTMTIKGKIESTLRRMCPPPEIAKAPKNKIVGEATKISEITYVFTGRQFRRNAAPSTNNHAADGSSARGTKYLPGTLRSENRYENPTRGRKKNGVRCSIHKIISITERVTRYNPKTLTRSNFLSVILLFPASELLSRDV